MASHDYDEFRDRLVHHQGLLDCFEVGYRGSPRACPELPSAAARARYVEAPDKQHGTSNSLLEKAPPTLASLVLGERRQSHKWL